jgi:hypothetical protein
MVPRGAGEFPVPTGEFPVRAKKFPAPAGQGIGLQHTRVTGEIGDWKSRNGGKFAKFAVKFPAIREFENFELSERIGRSVPLPGRREVNLIPRRTPIESAC